jgi:hypothetical protein
MYKSISGGIDTRGGPKAIFIGRKVDRRKRKLDVSF